jgi:hypothetical protein
MFDLLYLAGHPLTAAIHKRHIELAEKARGLPEGSPERNTIERRVSQLEQYCLPKPDRQEQEKREPLVNRRGEVVGVMQSIRRRFKKTARGRPESWRVQVRAALEQKLADPGVTWRQLANNFNFRGHSSWRPEGARGVHRFVPGEVDLERQVRLLKALLRREGIPLRPAPDPSIKIESLSVLFPNKILPIKEMPDP